MVYLPQRLRRQTFRLPWARLTTKKQLEHIARTQVEVGLLAIVRPV